MSTANNLKTLSDFVETKINDNPFFSVKKNELINGLVQAIKNENIININGATGTGKDYLANEIIVPQLKKRNNIQRLNIQNKNIKSISNEIDHFLNYGYSKILIISDDSITPSSGVNKDNEAITKIRNILDNAHNIYLPNLQELFLDFPVIIESFLKKFYDKSLDKITVGIVGYLDILICGLPKNFESLKKIMESEPPTEYAKMMALRYSNIGYISTFNSYLDMQIKRKKIWTSFWKGSDKIELKKIVSINETFVQNARGKIDQPSSGPMRMHPKSVVLETIKSYCKKFFINQDIKNINDHVFEPLNTKIMNIESGNFSFDKRITSLIFFKNKSNLKSKKATKFFQDDDYHTIRLNGETYHFSDSQAEVLKYIYEKYADGTEFRGSIVLLNLHKKEQYFSDVFKSRKFFIEQFLIRIDKKSGIYQIHTDYREINF